jgi:hypothetical protein
MISLKYHICFVQTYNLYAFQIGLYEFRIEYLPIDVASESSYIVKLRLPAIPV